MASLEQVNKTVFETMKKKGHTDLDIFFYLRTYKLMIPMIVDFTVEKNPDISVQDLASVVVTDLLSLPLVEGA